eukprot:1329125-Pleurochrysis_carterae.AAC.1
MDRSPQHGVQHTSFSPSSSLCVGLCPLPAAIPLSAAVTSSALSRVSLLIWPSSSCIRVSYFLHLRLLLIDCLPNYEATLEIIQEY